MPITPGNKLRHYEIVEPIGAGGMGEVYRARDTTLARDVAIKVLKDELARDGDRLERFEREAKLLAQLSHPNVATIHGLEKLDGQTFLVMELVEGETLAERIARGRIRVDEVVALFVQIADGLQAAHERGIIHRDLKPANIKIAPDGTIKILDFGLAKAFASVEDVAAETSQSPTLTKETALGVILGTAAYMSPEQARGKPVDTRTDVWAFGACLYEAITGTRAFEGESVADVIGAVVHKEPDWSRLPAKVSSGLERALRRSLVKDTRQRLQAVGDARLDLQDTDGSSVDARPGANHGMMPAVTGFGLGALLVSLATWLMWPSAAPSNNIVPRQLTSNPIQNTVTAAAISADGRYLAFVDGNGLFVRLIDSGETHEVETPDGFEIGDVDWYPDGSSLLVSSAGRDTSALWRMSVLGGAPRKLAERRRRASIAPDGSRIAYVDWGLASATLGVMGANGEDPQTLISRSDGTRYSLTAWSPDSGWLLYGVESPDQTEVAIEAIRPDGSETKRVLSDPRLRQGWTGVLPFCWVSDNRLIYSLAEPGSGRFGANLWSIDIDPATLQPRGQPTRITHMSGYNPRHVFVSANGLRMSFLLENFQEDVYIGELDGDGTVLLNTRRLTLDDRNDRPRGWLGDSQTVLFQSDRTGSFSPYRQHVDATTATGLHSGSRSTRFAKLASDGEWILFMNGDELVRVPVTGGPPEGVVSLREQAYRHGFRFDCVPGERCVLGEGVERSGEYVFHSLDPVEGKGGELARVEDRPPFVNWALSPDARRVAIVNNNGGLRLLELDTGVVEEVQKQPWRVGEFVAWDAAGRGVYADARHQADTVGRIFGKQLVYVPLDREADVQSLRRSRSQWFVHPTASPDGRYLAYGVVTFSANAWMLEGF